MSTLAHLLFHTAWPDIKAALLWLYPESRHSVRAYRDVCRTLSRLDPQPTAMRICIRPSPEVQDDSREWHEVYGRNGTLNREQEDFRDGTHAPDAGWGAEETRWSLCLTPWEQWLGMSVDTETLARYPAPQLIAHCLWEMTFHGFTQPEVQAVLSDLKRQVAELEAMSEEDRAKLTVPHEEVAAWLRELARDDG